MKSAFAALGIGWLISFVAADQGEIKITHIDLQPKANQKLAEGFHRHKEDNILPVPKGVGTFANQKFKIEASLVQLSSPLFEGMPEKVEGIKVDQKLTKLHILHGTGYGAYGEEKDGLFVKDDTLIGEYKIVYDDKTTAIIPIVYGKDVRDWWDWDQSKPVTRGTLAWVGENENSKQYKVKMRLYSMVWQNPHPDKRVVQIDYRTTGTPCAPFCIAITAESK